MTRLDTLPRIVERLADRPREPTTIRCADETKHAWAAYRQARAEAGLPTVGLDHFGYAAFVYVGDTHDEGVQIGSKLLWFVNTSLKSAPQYAKFLPGTVPPQFAPRTRYQNACPGAGFVES